MLTFVNYFKYIVKVFFKTVDIHNISYGAKEKMGLNVGSIYAADYKTPKIDIKALNGVAERIFNPDNERTVDVSSLNLSKFNRVSLGTDLYSQRTANEVVLKAAKAVTDYGINFSNAFNTNIQYLNSIAAQSLLLQKKITEKL